MRSSDGLAGKDRTNRAFSAVLAHARPPAAALASAVATLNCAERSGGGSPTASRDRSSRN